MQILFFSCIQNTVFYKVVVFSKFYGKVGVISWFLFHLIWKNYVLYWDFDLKSWIVDFFTCFIWEKTPQNNFSSQNFSVENNYFLGSNTVKNWYLKSKLYFILKLKPCFIYYMIINKCFKNYPSSRINIHNLNYKYNFLSKKIWLFNVDYKILTLPSISKLLPFLGLPFLWEYLHLEHFLWSPGTRVNLYEVFVLVLD